MTSIIAVVIAIASLNIAGALKNDAANRERAISNQSGGLAEE
jgi:hypothetical protein